jgi:Zn-finger nucleic acid-binding protein
MNCIRCQTKMRKVSRDNVLVDRCPDCGGIWLDEGELNMLEEGAGHEDAVIMHQARKELLHEAQRLVSLVGFCPKCEQARLQQVKKRGVELDVCPKCSGIYLDEGELDKVLGGKKDSFIGSLLVLIRG